MSKLKFIQDPNKELQEMLKAAVHFGHNKKKWNPKMRDFLFTTRRGVHIIDLHQTITYLDEALAYLNELAKQGKTILMVSTKQQANPIVTKVAAETKMPFVTFKWIPGLLTNFGTVSQRIAKLKKLKQERDNGEFGKYTKKEAVKLHKLILKLEEALGGVEDMAKRPDALFVVDVVRDAIAVKEARVLGIPVIGIIDSNSDPDTVDYAIPANDDAIKSLEYLMGKVQDALTTK